MVCEDYWESPDAQPRLDGAAPLEEAPQGSRWQAGQQPVTSSPLGPRTSLP